ncbi:MAG: hypothetical protein H5T61_12640 [Thermoflexales bacterium]|nr:hypothetical protein [Thermoflexales bacterium]
MQGYPPYRYGLSEEATAYGPRPVSPESRVAKRLGVVLLVFTAAFGLALAVIIGQRLSDQAMAVLAGSVCGVAASIPPSLLIIWVTRRKQEQKGMPTAGLYPPVVVVQPPAAYPPGVGDGANRYLPPAYAPMGTIPTQREFVVVGEE